MIYFNCFFNPAAALFLEGREKYSGLMTHLSQQNSRLTTLFRVSMAPVFKISLWESETGVITSKEVHPACYSALRLAPVGASWSDGIVTVTRSMRSGKLR